MANISAASLEGKSALVLGGGGGGIGATIARTLASAGAKTAVADIELKRASETVAQITGDGHTALALAGDVRQANDADMLVERTRQTYGGFDILVNAVGGTGVYARWRKLEDWSEEDWDLIAGLNLRYMFLTCRAALRAMREQGRGGSIVNLASISGLQSAPNHAPYGAAKAGVMSLTRTLAVEYGPIGVRVNAVAPGAILTDPVPPSAIRPDGDPNPHRGSLEKRASASPKLGSIPLGGKMGRPDDIANAVLFFACDLSKYVTGQVLLVDGGASVRWDLGDVPPGGR